MESIQRLRVAARVTSAVITVKTKSLILTRWSAMMKALTSRLNKCGNNRDKQACQVSQCTLGGRSWSYQPHLITCLKKVQNCSGNHGKQLLTFLSETASIQQVTQQNSTSQGTSQLSTVHNKHTSLGLDISPPWPAGAPPGPPAARMW